MSSTEDPPSGPDPGPPKSIIRAALDLHCESADDLLRFASEVQASSELDTNFWTMMIITHKKSVVDLLKSIKHTKPSLKATIPFLIPLNDEDLDDYARCIGVSLKDKACDPSASGVLHAVVSTHNLTVALNASSSPVLGALHTLKQKLQLSDAACHELLEAFISVLIRPATAPRSLSIPDADLVPYTRDLIEKNKDQSQALAELRTEFKLLSRTNQTLTHRIAELEEIITTLEAENQKLKSSPPDADDPSVLEEFNHPAPETAVEQKTEPKKRSFRDAVTGGQPVSRITIFSDSIGATIDGKTLRMPIQAADFKRGILSGRCPQFGECVVSPVPKVNKDGKVYFYELKSNKADKIFKLSCVRPLAQLLRQNFFTLGLQKPRTNKKFDFKANKKFDSNANTKTIQATNPQSPAFAPATSQLQVSAAPYQPVIYQNAQSPNGQALQQVQQSQQPFSSINAPQPQAQPLNHQPAPLLAQQFHQQFHQQWNLLQQQMQLLLQQNQQLIARGGQSALF